uniref:DUF4160 domain-containing protein n=1 Tax=Candidatus Kentrum sp. SD TaxID=2126332 RepID=A0A450YCH0_9GAMM|nr:MAG: protein of unknown function (DUF4160) [Candidatus Kentron sp. SD]
MPTISMFYGIIVSMYFFDNKKHNKPHIHAEYGEYTAVFSIEDGELLDGKLPNKKRRMVQGWIAIHEDELMANWKLSVQGKDLFNIDPLK